MGGAPVVGNVHPARDPHAVVLFDVVQEALQRAHAPGPAEQTAVHADAHHAGVFGAFVIVHVKGVAQVFKELVAVAVALGQGKAHVVAVQRVGHHQVWSQSAVGLSHLQPEGQVVAVVVAVVGEATEVGHQASGVGAVAAGVPARAVQHAFSTVCAVTRHAADDVHADAHVFPLGGLVDALVVDPAPAVAGDFMAHLHERGGHLRAALQRHGDAEHRQRQAALFKLSQDAPHAHAAAVLVHAFHAQVARREGWRVEHLGEKLLAAGVAVQHGVLAAFFVVQHELHGHAGVAGPPGLRRVAAVAQQVAGIGGGCGGVGRAGHGPGSQR